MSPAERVGVETIRRVRWSVADTLTVVRVPLAVAFFVVPDTTWRFGILTAAAASDLLDGKIARRFGSSRFGVFIDPVADKLFMASAFAVVLLSGRLRLYEVIAVLARDLVAAFAFAVVTIRGRPVSIPARLGGKAVTVLQLLTLVAFLANSSLLRPMTWATGAVALYAIWDYHRAAPDAQPVGEGPDGEKGGST
ncbi:MAG: CDP-alcohol phosphatidyltransferase family protein [Gemmatimonadales bacterium]|nr:MAG: CDP-alcohol phosphatidyltransferase family protein [Gemmatimonadales bacterium]